MMRSYVNDALFALQRSAAVFAILFALLALPAAAQASHIEPLDRVQFDFAGRDGFGLLPGNEPPGPAVASADTTNAFGDEVGVGLVYDRATRLLNVEFEFEGLTGGLFTPAVSGIHLHIPAVPGDPFNQNGGIGFNLNSFDDPAVTNFNEPIAEGATSGAVSAVVSIDGRRPDLEQALLDGEFYLNIHSFGFPGGELRGSITPTGAVPEPSSLALLALAGAGVATRRRR